jgi:Helicase associated domain
MEPDRRQRLEALTGWSWNALFAKWEEGFAHLKQFSEGVGHCRVPDGYKTDDGYRLGQWVSNQRARKELIPPDRAQRLEALPGWVWKVKK